MIARLTSPSSRTKSILICSLSIVLPLFSAAQTSPVYSNPRAGSDDPRIGLKGGMHDAAEAAMSMQRVASLSKPPSLDPPPPPTPPGAASNSRFVGNGLTYANSDLAFSGTHLFMGNFYGITFYDIANPAKMSLLTTLICPGGQGDVSVYGHLLFMSVEGGGRIDCGTAPFPTAARPAVPVANAPVIAGAPSARPARSPEPADAERIRGIRIFDISDITKPKQVAEVQTCRGSHTHTLLVDPKDKDDVYVYIAGSAGVRPAEELAGCSAGEPSDDPNTALFTIVVIKVPLAHPEQAKVVSSPRIFSDPQSGSADGLWKGGTHGEGTQTSSATRGCHDITVYSAIGLAAGACSGNGILLNIADPVNPVRIDAVTDPNFAFWHSANFSNDGSKLIFTDEWGGGTQPRCRSTDPMNWGADTIFSLNKGKLTLDSYYKMPAAQTEMENCVAHNGSLLPIPGRDILVQAWYQGGISLMDFTDPTHPTEIGYYDRGPVDPEKHVIGGAWSAYWYNGYIYDSEIARGVDVFKLVPSKFLTQNEIDAATQVHFGELNVQNQPKISWPPNSVTARAYLDQLARSEALAADRVTALSSAIDKKKTKELKAMATSLEKDAAAAKTPADAQRMHSLAEILKQGGM